MRKFWQKRVRVYVGGPHCVGYVPFYWPRKFAERRIKEAYADKRLGVGV